jgi:hypothetical protein
VVEVDLQHALVEGLGGPGFVLLYDVVARLLDDAHEGGAVGELDWRLWVQDMRKRKKRGVEVIFICYLPRTVPNHHIKLSIVSLILVSRNFMYIYKSNVRNLLVWT